MTKRELVIDVAERLGYTQNEVANVVQATLDAITESLVAGHRIEVRNFGVFEVKKRDARIGRNPRIMILPNRESLMIRSYSVLSGQNLDTPVRSPVVSGYGAGRQGVRCAARSRKRGGRRRRRCAPQ